MAIFNSYVTNYQRVTRKFHVFLAIDRQKSSTMTHGFFFNSQLIGSSKVDSGDVKWCSELLGLFGQSTMPCQPPWLVVWNMTFMTFHILGMIYIIPTDELHHFSEGWLNHQPDPLPLTMHSPS